MLWFQLRSTTHGLDEAKPTPQCMLRGWLPAPLPGPAPPAWEGAGARAGGLNGAQGAQAEAVAEGRGWRAESRADGSPGPGEAAAAAGLPGRGLSQAFFVSVRGKGHVMSLLPRAGQQRRDKVTYPAPCPRPASPRCAASTRPQLRGWAPGIREAGGAGGCDCCG